MLDLSAYFIWVTTTGLLLAVVVGLFRSGVFKSLPYFTGLMIYEVLRSLFLAVVRQHSLSAYFYTYWFCEFVSTILGLLVIQEILMALLQERPYWRLLARWAFQISSSALILLTVAISSHNINGDSAQVTIIVLVLERALRIVQCGLLVFVIAFSGTFQLRWRHYLFGTTAGLAVIASCSLAVTASRLHFGRMANQQWLLLKPASYLVAAAVWTFYVWSAQSDSLTQGTVSQGEASQLTQWKSALEQVHPS